MFSHVILLIISFFLTDCTLSLDSKKNTPIPNQDGVLDLRDWDFSKDGSINLTNGWDFFWDELIFDSSNSQFTAFLEKIKSNSAIGKKVSLPHNWISDPDLANIPGSSFGVATYRIKIRTTENNLGILSVSEIAESNARIWIYENQKLKQILTLGNVAKNPETSTLDDRRVFVLFEKSSEEFELIIEVSNFHYKTGRLQGSIFLGNRTEIINSNSSKSMILFISLGIFLMTSIYTFVIWILRKSLIFSLIFSIHTLNIMIREFVLFRPEFTNLIPPDKFLVLEYLTLIITPIFFFYVRNILQEKNFKIPSLILLIYVPANILTLIIFPMQFYSKNLLPIYQISVILSDIFLTSLMIQHSFSKDSLTRNIARWLLFATIIYSLTVIIDIITSQFYLNIPYISGFGVLFNVLIDVYILSKFNSNQWETAESLSSNLEKIVVQRTNELLESNNKLHDEKRETERLNELFQSLNEKLDLETILNKIFDYINEKYQFNTYALYTLLPDKKHIQAILWKFNSQTISDEFIRNFQQLLIPINGVKGAHAICINSKNAVAFNRIRNSGITEEEKYKIQNLNIQTFLMIPLILENNLIGILDFSSELRFKISKEDLSKISILGKQFAGIVYNAKLHDETIQAKRDLEDSNAKLVQTQSALSKAERSSMINSMISHLAHEINNPLNYISTGEIIIKDSTQDLKQTIFGAIPESEESKGFIKKLEQIFDEIELGISQSSKGTTRIKSTIAEIRAITGVDGLHIDNLNLTPLIYSNLKLSFEKNQIFNESIKITINECQYPEEIKDAFVVVSQNLILSRAIRTLLNNSMHFAKKNPKPEVHIQINKMETSSKNITFIQVKNNGPAIEKGMESQLFDLKTNRYFGTELLGLSIVKEVLKTVQCNISLIDNGKSSGWVEFQLLIKDFE